jgi:hypothetical protein
MRVVVRKLGRHLKGKSARCKDFGLLSRQLAQARHVEIVFLDFEWLETVNAFWLNMSVVRLSQWAAECQNDYYPVFSGFPDGGFLELELTSPIRWQCYLISKTSTTDVDEVVVVGSFDPSLRISLERVRKSAQITRAELDRQSPDVGIKATECNSLLRDLFVKRHLIWRKVGRHLLFAPIVRWMAFLKVANRLFARRITGDNHVAESLP